MTPGTALREPVEHYSHTGSDPAKPLRQQLEEGMVLPGECVILGYHNRKRGVDVCVLFPTREAAERHISKLIREKAIHQNDGRCVIRSVGEALA